MKLKFPLLHQHLLVVIALMLEITLTQAGISAEKMTRILDTLINKKNYDNRLRPNYNGKPVDVKIGLWIISIDSIDVVNMDYTVDLFLRQEWVDPRLSHGLNETVHLSHRVIKHIWIPDSYFVNAKTGKLHHVTSLNMMVMIAPEGVVKYNSRVTVKAACTIDLRRFPMDKQICPLVLESYGYDNGHIEYSWEGNKSDGMYFVPDRVRIMPQYHLMELRLFKEVHGYIIGNFSAVRAEFRMERTYSYFLSHIYGTSTVIVFISWMAFVLPRDQTAARVAVGVTTLLTEVTVIDMLNSAMPKVSYVKSIDKFLITCLIFVFLSLAEYCLILILDRKRSRRRLRERSRYQGEIKDNVDLTNDPSKDAHNNKWFTENNSYSQVENPSSTNTSLHNHKPDCWERLALYWSKWNEWISSEPFLTSIDSLAMLAFPLTFGVFHFLYWMDYIG